MTREEIQRKFDAFFEFPSKDRSAVSSVSCRLFAEHIAKMAVEAERVEIAKQLIDLGALDDGKFIAAILARGET